MEQDKWTFITRELIGAAFEVRKQLGRFLYEEVYEQALQYELHLRGIRSERQVFLPISYKGVQLEKSYRIDLLVENSVIVELKALEYMGGKEISQILTYLKFSNLNVGYLINFGVEDFSIGRIGENEILDKGIYRFAL